MPEPLPTFSSLLTPEATPTEILDRAIDLTKTLYWQHKNIPAFRQLSTEALKYAFAIQRKMPDSPVKIEISSRVKTLHYNLASFLWPGWAEPGISLTLEDEYAGYLSALVNDDLASGLQKGPLAESRAKWMLAGHHLRNPDFLETAQSLYEEAAKLAQQANEPTEAAASTAFARWITTLLEPGDPTYRAHLEATLTYLRSLPEGNRFANQLAIAQKVFS